MRLSATGDPTPRAPETDPAVAPATDRIRLERAGASVSDRGRLTATVPVGRPPPSSGVPPVVRAKRTSEMAAVRAGGRPAYWFAATNDHK